MKPSGCPAADALGAPTGQADSNSTTHAHSKAITVVVVTLVTGGVAVGFAAWRGIDLPSLGLAAPEFLGVVVAIAVVGRGLMLGRPVSGVHGALAAVALVSAIAADTYGHAGAGAVSIVAAGIVLVCPGRSQPNPEALAQVWSLVKSTEGDPLAAFTMATGKSYVFSGDATAAIAYRTLGGFAVVSDDPIGNPAGYSEAVRAFAALCRARGWQVAVLGASATRLALWENNSAIGSRLAVVPIGRDVVIQVDEFNLVGRRKRNLRQAVQRTRNAGVTTQVVAENALNARLHAELRDVMISSRKAVGDERGFSMMLGGTLSGHFPGVWLIIARDHAGRIQGFHRYASAGAGTDLSLDLPWRRSDAPNGIDERLTVDMISWAKERGMRRVSLAFAPFPDLFARDSRTSIEARALRDLAHLLDRFIKLESLYRYLRKFDAIGEQRYVLFPLTHVIAAAAILLTLEFRPHRDPFAVPGSARYISAVSRKMRNIVTAMNQVET